MPFQFKLKELIKKKGLQDVSYRKLAEEIGINYVPLWKMINGKPYNASLDKLEKLCSFFKCQIGEILRYRR